MGFASSIFSCENPLARALVTSPLNCHTKRLRSKIMLKKIPKTKTLNAPYLRAWIKYVKKHFTKAPSAKIRRQRLGNLNATKKISLSIPAPKNDAIHKSRTKPKTREHKVPMLFVKNALRITNPLLCKNKFKSKKATIGHYNT